MIIIFDLKEDELCKRISVIMIFEQNVDLDDDV